jgi:uncharacterized RDD family membrane protein YckC
MKNGENKMTRKNMENSQYVGFGARFGASIIDTLLFWSIILSIYYLIYGAFIPSKTEKLMSLEIVLEYIFPFIATLVFWIYKSATPGKMFLKAIIVDATTYEKPTTKQLLIRNVGYYLSLLALGLGYFWIIWDKRKQGWHDKLANTLVIQPKSEKEIISEGSYFLKGLGVFFGVVFMGLVLMGIVLEFKGMPDGNLYKPETLSESVKQELLDKNLLNTIDELRYFQPDGSFSFTEEGTLITTKGINIFSTTEEGKISSNFVNFKDIVRLEIKTTEDLDISWADNVESTLGFKLLILYLYDENNKLLDYSVISIDNIEKENFEKKVLELWQSARGL